MATSLALTCQYEPCGKAFEAPRRRKYCEPLCERRAYSKKRLADGRHKAYRARTKDQRAAYMTENADRFKVERECLACGTRWKTGRKHAKYCSTACRDLMRPGVKESRLPGTHPARRGLTCVIPERHPARQGIPAPRRWVMGACRRCGAAYVVADNRRAPAYCGRACLRADGRATRRARKHAAYVAHVSPIHIHRRDGWTCQLCGQPVARDEVVPHPLAPVVDHVISLVNGGTHEPANVQCAHFMCNSIKGHRDDQPVPALMIAA